MYTKQMCKLFLLQIKQKQFVVGKIHCQQKG